MPSTKTAKPKPKGKKKHKCFEQVNERLAQDNARLDLRMMFDFKAKTLTMSGLPITLAKINSKSRKKLPTVLCTFCPFCGKNLEN